MMHSDVPIIASTLLHNGFLQTDCTDWYICWAGKGFSQKVYEEIKSYQRINHYPGSTCIAYKDQLAANIAKMKHKHGNELFNLMPETYILPEEYAEFNSACNQMKQQSQCCYWIIKPNTLSQGRGIYIVSKPSEVSMNESCIAMRYIDNPLLVNSLKFDLRIYVLVTSLRPLVIYVYNEGLTRFASEIYNGNKSNLKNTFAHLTNYAVNKHNTNFVYNMNLKDDDIGNKWSLSALFLHLESNGINTDLLWSRIYDIIIKTILSGLGTLNDSLLKTGLGNNNFFELFGFDILIDSNLKPWLLEVNMSPSLDCDTPLDLHVKSHLIADTFNLVSLKSKTASATLLKTISVMSKMQSAKRPTYNLDV